MAMRGYVAAGFITIVVAVFITVLVGAILANPISSAVNSVNTSMRAPNGSNDWVSNTSLVNIVPNINVVYVLMLLLVPVVGVMALAAIIS